MPAGQTVGGRGGVAVDSSGALCGRVVESARATAATATAFAPSWPLQALAWSRARRFDWWRLGNRGYLGERPLAAPTHPRTVVVHPSRLHRRSSPTPIARTTRPCGIGSVASRLDATTGPTSTAMTAFAFSEGDASRDRSQPLTLRSTIELTESERRIFDLLLQVNRYHRLNTVLRVAGGWVRDKLLGLAVQRADLDIAIDDMPGQAYALKVNEMLRATGHEQHAVHVIQANPEQSKHLETARMKLCGEWIDLAHLRKETYTEHSRIPQVTIGTPHEDAHRRDLTINALFYNIHSGDVEDFTGRGVEDLRHGRIRTPLAPRVTLLDDPLRILRAVRFGSRFDFDMVPELLQGGRDPEVHAALAAKVSRERVGAEVEGMFRGPRPERAVRWMSDMGLFPVVFSLPPDCARDYAADMSRQAAARLECLRALSRYWAAGKGESAAHFGPLERRVVYALCLSPLLLLQYRNAKRQQRPAVEYVLKEALKVSHRDAEDILCLLQAAEPLGEWVHRAAPLDRREHRVPLGRLLRSLGALWRAACLVQLTIELCAMRDGIADGRVNLLREQLEAPPLLTRFDQFIQAVERHQLADASQLRPLVGGNQLKVLLPRLPRGPQFGEVIEAQIDEQLARPRMTPRECAEWLRDTYAEYR
ncbi:hypothetical protein CDCA_CDCA03G0941 [Cyanidium caldarium]|uniref:Uncharacterized protein n=1 Tax=Cyanidium caldarium TaxID=2771 RepID=A0AAV9IS50_CYACA|nr:hypothetical protein CDCA_CDCA03G0941 [Cyanidium caldarium]